ncbi:Methionyl-tRNA formyltransferase [BD1-7 clade bacterium]|uniref:Methionyl-tRNA formyltransferase n=1 Tax=BD1-7 clade bacterium TaxID=2029982 RepID=A0A5S9MV39_9GAMM|nr:Methionyl-tRNA formyltransferase [BD1-7 clade bacterium]CAA0083331.1 Methionyl-tRNA formyltransferase [BD1-7 clade bacterium]
MTTVTEQAKNLRIVFAGTPDFAADHLQGLVDCDMNVVAVYCQPDRKSGRGKKLSPPPTKVIAQACDIPVFQPLNFKDSADVDVLASHNADVMVVVAYGLLLPLNVLQTPTHGCINVHGSLLPRWRGAAPIERAIEAGDTTTGITIMQMDEGLDTGDMLITEAVDITAETTGDSLRASLLPIGLRTLLEGLNQLAAQQLHPKKQDNSLANYARKLSKSQAAIDWQSSANDIDQKIRAFNSANVCTTGLGEMRIKVWDAEPIQQAHDSPVGTIIAMTKKWIDVACGSGVLRLKRLQLPNAKAMDVAAVLNGKGHLFEIGHCFA